MQSANEISVVIPMYNAESTIGTCLEAVFAKLKNLREVIVVDDCSTDRSVEIAGRFPCRIIKSNKRGLAGRARNLGVREASGRFILFLDSDCLLKEDISPKIARYIKPEENIIALVGIFSEEQAEQNLVSQYKNLHARYKYYLLPDFISSLHTSITAVDRESFWKVSGFDESSRVEDVELGETIVRAGYRIYLDKEMEVIHLKKLNLKNMLFMDFWKTGALVKHFWRIKDKKRIVKEGVINDISLYLPLSLLSGAAILPFLVVGIFFKPALMAAFFSLLIFSAVNRKFWGYLSHLKGRKFAIISSFITYLDMNCAALAVSTTFIKLALDALYRRRFFSKK